MPRAIPKLRVRELERLLREKPRKVAAVALANKTARIVWSLLARGEAHRLAA